MLQLATRGSEDTTPRTSPTQLFLKGNSEFMNDVVVFFSIFVVICFFILYFVFSLIFHCLISPTPGTVKAGCVLSVLAMAGPGPISRHYALSAAPDTSKMGTFPSAPPLAPAKMWIQLLNTGIGISNEHQLGGGAIYQLRRAAENENHFLLTAKIIDK